MQRVLFPLLVSLGLELTSPSLLLAQTNTSPETQLNGILDENSPKLEENDSYYQTHTFQGEAGETLTIDLNSLDFDAYLLLRDPDGEIIAENDDGGKEKNARIVIELPKTGEYAIAVTTYTTGYTGSYTLSWREATREELQQLDPEQLEPEQLAEQLTEQLFQQIYHTGKLEGAIPLAQRVLEMQQHLFGEDNPSLVIFLGTLAGLYHGQGRYQEAEPLYLQSLDLLKKWWGEHISVATSLNNLAGFYRDQGRYTEAESFYQEALDLKKRLLGEEHPSVANGLNKLAGLYQTQGRYAEAEPLYQQALEIRKNLLGEDHPDVATSLNNLAGLYNAQGDNIRAIDYLSQGLEIQETNLDTIIAFGSESEKQEYMNNLSGTTYQTISLHIKNAPNNLHAAKLALTTIFRRKGRILDAVADNLRTLRQNLTPENQQLLDDLTTTRSQLASLIFNKPKNLPLDYKQQVSQLQKKAGQLESQLASTSSQFRTQTQPVTIESVQKLIPTDAALLEFVVYNPYNNKTNEWESPHYAAYILKSTGEPQWVDLGEAEPINKAVKAFKRGVTNKNSTNQYLTSGKALHKILMPPILAKLGNTKHILLSPDGQLNLIPFAALIDKNNQLLVQDYQITYLTTGQDLIRLAESSESEQPPTIFVNPDYDQSNPTLMAANPQGTRSTRSTDLAQLKKVVPLPYTATEGETIANLYPNARLFTQEEATENAIKMVKSPQILHLATHGFFLNDLPQVAPFSGWGPEPTTPQQENPLLRSGLAFAGFNERQSGSEDGVLTALEVAGLNLFGTKLVVLSACETGVGDVNNGEGVYGLRRALAIAGSESQVMSLWTVDDEGTQELMTRYYQKLQQGEGRSAALRQAQLEMFEGGEFQHPYYWSAFIPSGEWRAMDN